MLKTWRSHGWSDSFSTSFGTFTRTWKRPDGWGLVQQEEICHIPMLQMIDSKDTVKRWEKCVAPRCYFLYAREINLCTKPSRNGNLYPAVSVTCLPRPQFFPWALFPYTFGLKYLAPQERCVLITMEDRRGAMDFGR